MKALQDLTGCKFSVLGRGTMKDKKKEDELRAQGGKYAHLNDEQHVLIEVFAAPGEGHLRLGHAINEVKKYLSPDFDDTTYMQNGDAAAAAAAAAPAAPALQPTPAGFAPPPGPRGLGPAPGVPVGRARPAVPPARPGMPPAMARPGMPPAMARPGMPPAGARPGVPPATARPGVPPAMARPGMPPARPPMAGNPNPAMRGVRPGMMPPSHAASSAAPSSLYGAPPQSAYGVQPQAAFIEQDSYAIGETAVDYGLMEQSQVQDPYLNYEQTYDQYNAMASDVQMQSVPDQQYGGFAGDYTTAADQWGAGSQDSSYGKVTAVRTAATARQQPYSATSGIGGSAAGGRAGIMATSAGTSGALSRGGGGAIGGGMARNNTKGVARRF